MWFMTKSLLLFELFIVHGGGDGVRNDDDDASDNNNDGDSDNNSFNFIIFCLFDSITFLLFFTHKGGKPSSDGGAVTYTTFGA